MAAETFEKLSSLGKEELKQFSTRREAAFAKNLVELAEFQVKHSEEPVIKILKK